MLPLGRFFRRLATDEKGVTAIEYGLIAALIAVGLIGAMTTLGDELQSMYDIIISAQVDAAID